MNKQRIKGLHASIKEYGVIAASRECFIELLEALLDEEDRLVGECRNPQCDHVCLPRPAESVGVLPKDFGKAVLEEVSRPAESKKLRPEQEIENWEKEFDERYDHYNPINDKGTHVPTWSGSDYEDIKSFGCGSFSTTFT